MSEDLVLVTGGSGFVAIHCIDQLLRAGYRVRTTVRSLSREAGIRAMLQHAGTPRQEALSFAVADLSRDEGWADAVVGCRYVHHVASPFPAKQPKHEDELIVPAREGTLRVLRAARDAGVARVVQTSSIAAIGYGHAQKSIHPDETWWTNLDAPGLTAYGKSKTLAERAAWDFIKREGGALELAVVNPAGIFGPIFGADFATSILIVQKLLNGEVPFCPRMHISVVDVRDVADLHLRAMTHPEAKGERFLAAADGLFSILDVGAVLKQHMGRAARRVPTRELPDWVIRLLAPVSSDLQMVKNELGKEKFFANEKAKRILGWQPRTGEEAIVSAGESLAQFNLLKK